MTATHATPATAPKLYREADRTQARAVNAVIAHMTATGDFYEQFHWAAYDALDVLRRAS